MPPPNYELMGLTKTMREIEEGCEDYSPDGTLVTAYESIHCRVDRTKDKWVPQSQNKKNEDKRSGRRERRRARGELEV